MSMATLIAYATKHGVTELCAKELQADLACGAELINLKERTPDLRKYDTVILGASVYAGMPRKQMKAFVANNAAELKMKRLGLFLCCMADGEQAQKQMDAAFTPELRKAALAQGVLGGGFHTAKMNFIEKFAVEKITGKKVEDSFDIYEDVLGSFIQAFAQK